MNPRMTKKDLDLIKGAIRRTFSRSDYRRTIMDSCTVLHFDTERPRVKKWGVCQNCNTRTPKYQMHADHIRPVVPLNRTLEDMGLEELIDAIWCERDNLQPICVTCHNIKTQEENRQRRRNKKIGKAA